MSGPNPTAIEGLPEPRITPEFTEGDSGTLHPESRRRNQELGGPGPPMDSIDPSPVHWNPYGRDEARSQRGRLFVRKR